MSSSTVLSRIEAPRQSAAFLQLSVLQQKGPGAQEAGL